jgi:hypothetical protein
MLKGRVDRATELLLAALVRPQDLPALDAPVDDPLPGAKRSSSRKAWFEVTLSAPSTACRKAAAQTRPS